METLAASKCVKHEWVVFSTLIEDRALFLQCVECGLAGTVENPSRKEWKRAFHAPSRPYQWHDESRIHQRDVLPLHVVRATPCQECDCPNKRRAEAKYERFPAEIVTPDGPLTTEEASELANLAVFVRGSDLCSGLFPLFVRGYQADTGVTFPKATNAIADRVEKIHRMGLHCSSAVVGRVLQEYARTPPRSKTPKLSSRLPDVLPVRDHYWMLHDGEKYAKHGSEERNGVLVFLCQERAEQFVLTVGKALPQFQPIKVSALGFFREAEQVGAFAIADGLSVTVCEISKAVDHE